MTDAYLANEESYLGHVAGLVEARWPAVVPRELRYPLGRKPLTDYLRDWARRTPD